MRITWLPVGFDSDTYLGAGLLTMAGALTYSDLAARLHIELIDPEMIDHM
jgi:hypothetical protein